MKTINYIYIILIINEYITSNQSAFLLMGKEGEASLKAVPTKVRPVDDVREL